MRAFGEVLVENRKKKGYSQADLVDLLAQEGIEVTTKAVSKWENQTCIIPEMLHGFINKTVFRMPMNGYRLDLVVKFLEVHIFLFHTCRILHSGTPS